MLLNTEKEVKCIVHLSTIFLTEINFYNLELGGLSHIHKKSLSRH